MVSQIDKSTPGQERRPFEIVVLKDEIGVEGKEGLIGKDGGAPDSNLNKEDTLRDYIIKSTTLISPTDSLKGHLKLIDIMANGLRNQIFSKFAETLRHSNEKETSPYSRNIVWMEQALMDHVEKHPWIDVGLLDIFANDFGLNNASGKLHFQDAIGVIGDRKKSKGHFPREMFQDNFNEDIIKEMIEVDFYSDQEYHHTQGTLNTKFLEETQQLLRKEMARILAVADLESIIHSPPDVSQWVDKNIPQYLKNKASSFDIGPALVELANRYYVSLGKEDVYDVKIHQEEAIFNPYQSMRFWALVIDRAVTKLPWAKISNFFMSQTMNIADNLALGTKSSVLQYYFKQRDSLSLSGSLELTEIFSDDRNDPYPRPTKEGLEENRKGFLQHCKRLLLK